MKNVATSITMIKKMNFTKVNFTVFFLVNDESRSLLQM